ncbi:transposase [Rhizobium rhododendri]|uniref:Transposase n=1 Tax=Rhizobium rhododendri TaxID=2506430 RepID=A0ABY8IRK6_9HYPH|nr:transposase [Rhizobium rhododendri]WFS26356.1 transposase [Rhizobium rhododendri]
MPVDVVGYLLAKWHWPTAPGNTKQLASYVGLAPMPHQSSNVDRDQRIGRARNARRDAIAFVA